MLGLGSPELIIVLVLVLILFGGAKVPQLMRGLGEGMREFKKATRDDDEPVKIETRAVDNRVDPRSVEARAVESKPMSTYTEPRV